MRSDERLNASLNWSRAAPQGAALGPAGANPPWLDDMKFVMMGVMGPLWEIPGLVTSALSIVLLKLDKSIQSSVRIILIALAAADVLFLLGTIFCVQLDLYATRFRVGGLHSVNRVVQSSACSVVNIAEMFRNWLTVLIGIERFIATNFPLSAKRLCSTRRIWLATGIIFFCSVLLRVPYVYRWWLRETFNLTISDLNEHKLAAFAQRLHTNIDSFGLVIIPLIILTVLSILIIRKINLSHTLHSSMQNEALNLKSRDITKSSFSNEKNDLAPLNLQGSPVNSDPLTFSCNAKNTLQPPDSVVLRGTNTRFINRHEHRRNQVAKMLLFILLLFAVFGVPQIVYVLVQYLQLPKAVRHALVIVVWTSSMIYSNTNFFVYIAYMSKYRQMLKIVICKFACTYKRWQRYHCEQQNRTLSLSASACDSSCIELPSVAGKVSRAGNASRQHGISRFTSASRSSLPNNKHTSRRKQTTNPQKTVRCVSVPAWPNENAEGSSSIEVLSMADD